MQQAQYDRIYANLNGTLSGITRDPRGKQITVKQLARAIEDFKRATELARERLEARSQVTRDITERFVNTCSF